MVAVGFADAVASKSQARYTRFWVAVRFDSKMTGVHLLTANFFLANERVTMSQQTVHVCPLCGSTSVTVSDPNAAQTAVGATCTLKCECGAVVTLDVEQKGNADRTKEKA
jgi:hypothetical protein